MDLGRHLHELFRLRRSVIICLLLASIAAINSAYSFRSLFPPALEPRSVEMASATTEVLVDTPYSAVLDLRQGSSEMESMTSRAVLIGNVMASPPVLRYIGERAAVPAEAIRAQPPLTPDFPRPLSGFGEDPETRDLLKSTDQYRLNITANPTVPVLQVYAQAPSADAAATLANASVEGLRDYLEDTARTEGTPTKDVVRLQQLGRASGTVINGGVRPQLIVLTFLIVFGLCSATAILIDRMRRGWKQAAAAHDVTAEDLRDLDLFDDEAGATYLPPKAPARSA
jgi:hypothetical protein